MAKNKTRVSDLLSRMEATIAEDPNVDNYIPDIMTFVESPKYLNMTREGIGVELYPPQKLILKAFYRGSRGNENLDLSEEDIKLCKRLGLDGTSDPCRGNVLGKVAQGDLFRELILILGRRSGKDFLASIIALYEAMKLIEIPGGDPYKYYDIGSGQAISIITVAASSSQAKLAFNEMKDKIMRSDYFSTKFLNDGLEADKMYLLTPADKLQNKIFEEKGMPLKKGSICIQVGHSNPDTLVGISAICMIADEVASYKSGTGGPSTGDQIYQKLTPTINTYVKRTPILDENGEQLYDEMGRPLEERRYDGKVVSISSPRGMDGKLYSLYETSQQPDSSDMLMFKLPTWEVNYMHTRDSLRSSEKRMNDEEFNMEYGAEFSGSAGESFFPRDCVDNCFKTELKLRDVGEPGKTYFAHLDPAINSHNYALVIVHKENFINKETNKMDYAIVVDHIKVWHPTSDTQVQVEEVDEYLISLRKRFHLGLVTYDAWNSASSIQKMKKHGIPAKKTPYNQSYKMEIYTGLEALVISGKLFCPYHGLLREEMINLQRKYMPRGFKIYPLEDALGKKTDDVVDALAGAIGSCTTRNVHKLPKGKLVNLPQASSSEANRVWRSPSGVMGVGPGQHVQRQLERRASYPDRLRNR